MTYDDTRGTIVNSSIKLSLAWYVKPYEYRDQLRYFGYLQSTSFHFLNRSWNLKFYPNCNTTDGWAVKLTREITEDKEYSMDLCIRITLMHGFYRKDGEFISHTFTKDNQCYSKRTRRTPGYVFQEIRRGCRTEILCSVKEECPQPEDDSSFCSRQLSHDFKELLMSERKADFLIKVGEATFPVHKLILTARSEVFKKQLSCKWKEQHERFLEIKHYDVSTVQYFLTFLYTGQLERCLASYKEAMKFYKMAHFYCVTDLVIICSQFLRQNICADTAVDFLAFAIKYSDSSLEMTAKSVVGHYKNRIILTEKWEIFKFENESVAEEILTKPIDFYA